MSKEMREQINKVKNFGQFINESKKYRIYNAPSGTPRETEINGKPLLWGMLGPLPKNVVDYINTNQEPVRDYRDGLNKIALHPTTGEPYTKVCSGNGRDYVFFDEETKNWWCAHERFQGKAILLSPDEWNEIFN